MKRSRAFIVALAVITGGALLVGGLAIASNVGFKLVYPLTWGTNPIGADLGGNDFQVSIPFNTPLLTADDLLQAAGTFPTVVGLVSRIEPSDGSTQTWIPGISLPNFSLSKGEGYNIRVAQNQATTLTLVGSHDPSFVLNFAFADSEHLISVPYHTTWQKANDVLDAINPPGPGKLISKLVPASNLTISWSPGLFPPVNNFDIVIGEAYKVKVPSAPQTLVPEHF